MNPLFSIITVTYNASRTLPATLKSINEQSCRLFQYIIVDGASTDNTVELAQNSNIDNIEIISEPDYGLYDAMNKGLGLAKGDYVLFLNAGDTFHSPDTLQHFADAIFSNDYPGIVYGQTDIVDYNRNRLGPRHFSPRPSSPRRRTPSGTRRSWCFANLPAILTHASDFQPITRGVSDACSVPIETAI